jgi:hypothetical protein
MTEQIFSPESEQPIPGLRRAFRRGPQVRPTRRPRRAMQPPVYRRLAEWHQMTPGERHVAWSQLRAWVTWLHDRYELGIDDRLPRCWPQHPGLVEELWALKAWRQEIYEASQPSGQAARYWHTELRQVIQAATNFYAAGCRTGHRGPRGPAAEDARVQQRWATASPLAGIPTAHLSAAGQQRGEPGQWVSPSAIAEALDNGTAHALSAALPDYMWCAGAWWRPAIDGWTRVTDSGLAARLDSWAAQIAKADQHAVRRLGQRPAGADGADRSAEAPASSNTTPAQPT